jgi:class 3 adenylate cyclase
MVMSAGDQELETRVTFSVIGLAWPHIAYLLATRADGRWREEANVSIDWFLSGLVVAVLAFRIWPTTAIYAILVINALLWGGAKFMLMGLGISVVAVSGAAWTLGVGPHPETEVIPTALSIIAIFSYITLVGTTAYRLRMRQRETRNALEHEERQSRELLVNVFPQVIIPRLKGGENPIADQFADVTVVFADIVEFTPLSERLGPRRTVLLLNELFAKFDQAAARLGVEKIETTGDGYLAVGGAPAALDNHPEATADFALAMIDAARSTRISSENDHVHVRVGIHTGPVFAGVIGDSRFHYKIFGETVNVASRVQSQARAGTVLVSETTFKRIQRSHALREHATLELKGHGPMRMFWLLSPAGRPPLDGAT